MFDLIFLVVLGFAFVRSVRARFTFGVGSALASALLLIAVGASAFDSRAGEGDIAVPLGVVFVGPGAILHERQGALAFLASPIAVATTLIALAGGAQLLAERRRSPLYPESPEAHLLGAASAAFIGAATFAAIKLVVAILFRLMTRNEF
ncbi:MAG: hypothetical protein HOW73_10565 [Polyangiaceae bacterium]|nr:hypothetical protein [Polyangiaceae bacterium]